MSTRHCLQAWDLLLIEPALPAIACSTGPLRLLFEYAARTAAMERTSPSVSLCDRGLEKHSRFYTSTDRNCDDTAAGQGLLSIFLGLILMDYPDKFQLERKIVSRAKLLRLAAP